jgi:hypothetical protein
MKFSSVVKGLALAVLYPAAFVYVASKKIVAAAHEVSDESLTVARTWEEQAEKGLHEATDQVSKWAAKQTHIRSKTRPKTA